MTRYPSGLKEIWVSVYRNVDGVGWFDWESGYYTRDVHREPVRTCPIVGMRMRIPGAGIFVVKSYAIDRGNFAQLYAKND